MDVINEDERQHALRWLAQDERKEAFRHEREMRRIKEARQQLRALVLDADLFTV